MYIFGRYSVNDALSTLDETNEDYSSVDLYILPPDSTLSDGDSDDEDEPESLNHLSGKQLAAPTEVVMHTVEPATSSSLQNESSSTTRKATKRTASGEKKRKRKWVDEDIASELPDDNPKLQFTNKDWTPVEFFEFFFDHDLMNLIVEQSVLYARQCGNHSYETSIQEMRSLLGILLVSGYTKVPRRRMYWELSTDTHNDAIASAMSRNRFLECLRYLHFADNEQLDANDRYAKVRMLFTDLNQKWLLYFPQNSCLSINESMVPYFGRHGLKQHIHGKPIRFGYKVWCMCTPEGYLIQAEPYQGANTGDNIEGLGMGGSVVADLISELPHSNFSLFFDNLFTSLPLMDYLSEVAFGGTGTIRLNRTEKAPLQEPASMKKKSRGSFEQKTDKDAGITLVRWNDNSIVTMASNCLGVAPLKTARRWSQAEKKTIEVQQPHLIHLYNKKMGGVDQMDHNIGKLRPAICTKKWWWPLF